MNPTLRAARVDDEEFLYQLYATTREAEFSFLGWDRAKLDALLRMQFSAQMRWYTTAYPSAAHSIVMLDGTPVGRILVHHGPEATTLVDISLLPQHRGRGTGGELIRDLIDECSQQKAPLRLQVLKTNPAARLYVRLGFVTTSEDGMYFQMEKQPG